MSGKKQDVNALVIGGEPRIDFLPLEIKQRKENRKSRRSLITLVIAVIVVCLGGYAFSAATAVQSVASVDAERARTAQLLQEQTKYAEARTVATDTAAADAAALVGSADEILWKKYVQELQDVLPEKTSIVQFSINSKDVLAEDTATEVIPLQAASIADVLFTVETPSLASIDKLNVNLRELPGFAGASTVLLTSDPDEGSSVFTVNVVLRVNTDVLERRLFETKELVDPDAPADAEAPAETPTEG